MKKNGFALLIFLACFFSCSTESTTQYSHKDYSWEEIETQASGTSVTFMMWQGSPVINDYMQEFVVPTLKERYHIDLVITGGQGQEIVQLLMGEKQANATSSQVDMVWINGETFFQLRTIDGLYGPFVDALPNSQYVDFDDPFISIDFQQEVNGMEAPWGISQFALVYDSAKTPEPPRNMAELKNFVEKHPGSFTISNDFSGMTMLKSLLAEIGGSPTSLDGPFDEDKYNRLSDSLWNYLRALKPNLWKSGSTFPNEHSTMDQLFASGELLLNFGFSEGGIEEKVHQGLFPKSTRGYAWANGTVRNANYLGITQHAQNVPGALVVVNFLMSPEAQFEKRKVNRMNANTVLSIDKLPEEWQQRFIQQAGRQYGPESADLAPYAIKEPAPEYMLRLYEDFRTEIIEK